MLLLVRQSTTRKDVTISACSQQHINDATADIRGFKFAQQQQSSSSSYPVLVFKVLRLSRTPG